MVGVFQNIVKEVSMPSADFEYFSMGLPPDVMLAVDRVVQRRKEKNRNYSKRALFEAGALRDKEVRAELALIRKGGVK